MAPDRVSETAGLEAELVADARIKSLVADEDFARALYAALCNREWIKGEQVYSCTWRYAGGLLADLRGLGEDYVDFYCSGHEGRVRADVEAELLRLGWISREL